MISGNFSSTEESQDLSIPFYCHAYEQELFSSAGFGELTSRPSSPVMSLYDSFPTSFADPYPSTITDINDPGYFLGLDDVDRLLPPIDFQMPSPPQVAQVSAADVKPGVQEEYVQQEVLPTKRYAPYPVPSGPEQEKRKRGRPMKIKPSGESKMATYSRQYRELKKSQLALAENATAELKKENEELRSQLYEVRNYNQQLEQEVEHLRQMMYNNRSFSSADVPVAAHY